MFAHRLLVAEIVMLLHQAVEQRLVGGAPNLLELQRAQFASVSASIGVGVNQHRRRPCALGQWIMPHVIHRRQGDLASALQHQQQAAAHHVAQCTIALPPLPGLT